MNLGNFVSYEVYVMRYSRLELLADNFKSIHEALEFSEAHGWDTRQIEIVQIETTRKLVQG